jgi:hypothetical protein
MTTESRELYRPLKLTGLMIAYLGLLVTALVAVWIGIQDVFSAGSLSDQLVGLSYLLAGVIGFAGFAVLIGKTTPPDDWRAVLGGAGAMAGLYVDITIAFYSFRYEPVKAGIFGALALLDLLLAGWLLPTIIRGWGDIDRVFAGAAGVAAALAVVAQFWYQSVYLSGSSQVGIKYSITAGPVFRSDSNRLVTLTLTMKNVSSAPAIVLNSMLVVTGISYVNGTKSGVASPTETQRNMNKYASTLPQKSFYFTAPKLPDIGYSGQLKPRTLAAWRPLGPNTYLYPNAAYSRDFVVVIPDSGVQAIDARAKIQYARAARLTPGAPYPGSELKSYPVVCKDDKRSAYYIDQSALRRFTNGTLIFITNWCADITHPDIKLYIAGIRGAKESVSTESALVSHYGVTGNTAIATFALNRAIKTIP